MGGFSLIEDDAGSRLFCGDTAEFSNVWGVGVRGGEEWGLGLVAVLVSDVGDLSDAAVREGEPKEK